MMLTSLQDVTEKVVSLVGVKIHSMKQCRNFRGRKSNKQGILRHILNSSF